MSQPLIPHHKGKEWADRMAKACSSALAKQRRSTQHTALASITAAGKSRPSIAGLNGAVTNSQPWSSDEWASNVEDVVAPVANKIAAEAISAAKAPLPPMSTMGMPTSGADMASNMITAALNTGNSIGDRLNSNVASAADADEADAEMDAAFDTADAIMDNIVGSMASQCASLATSDVTSFLASSFGLVYSGATKTWATMEDDAVRPDHEDADGQQISLNGTFTVGGEDMTGPGDPTASDDQTMGCRCMLETDGVLPEGTDAPDDYA